MKRRIHGGCRKPSRPICRTIVDKERRLVVNRYIRNRTIVTWKYLDRVICFLYDLRSRNVNSPRGSNLSTDRYKVHIQKFPLRGWIIGEHGRMLAISQILSVPKRELKDIVAISITGKRGFVIQHDRVVSVIGSLSTNVFLDEFDTRLFPFGPRAYPYIVTLSPLSCDKSTSEISSRLCVKYLRRSRSQMLQL